MKAIQAQIAERDQYAMEQEEIRKVQDGDEEEFIQKMSQKQL